mmetsp:Transcript_21709/g.58068  ORF Transcript_21709/g.58068 Transcript_21709/m.58068 type:complete len:253 (+) Transcript_21709:362-1120(+)
MLSWSGADEMAGPVDSPIPHIALAAHAELCSESGERGRTPVFGGFKRFSRRVLLLWLAVRRRRRSSDHHRPLRRHLLHLHRADDLPELHYGVVCRGSAVLCGRVCSPLVWTIGILFTYGLVRVGVKCSSCQPLLGACDAAIWNACRRRWLCERDAPVQLDTAVWFTDHKLQRAAAAKPRDGLRAICGVEHIFVHHLWLPSENTGPRSLRPLLPLPLTSQVGAPSARRERARRPRLRRLAAAGCASHCSAGDR